MAIGTHLYNKVLYRMIGSHYLGGSNAGVGDVRAGTTRLRWNLGDDGDIGLKSDATSYSVGSRWVVHHIYTGVGSRYEVFNAQMAIDGGGTTPIVYSTTVSVAPLGEAARTQLEIKFGSGTGVVWGTLGRGLAAMFQDDPVTGTITNILAATYYEMFSAQTGFSAPYASGTGILTKTISGTVATLVTAVATMTGSLNTQRMIVFGSVAGVAGTVPVLDFFRYDGNSEAPDNWPTLENGDTWQATFYIDVFSGTIGILDPGSWE